MKFDCLLPFPVIARSRCEWLIALLNYMLMHHIAMFGELPFQPRIPNAETLQTFKDTDAGENLTRHESVEDIFAEFNRNDL